MGNFVATEPEISAIHGRVVSVCFPAGFDSDTIVAGIKETVFDKNVFARFRIAAIVIRAMTGDVQFADDDNLDSRSFAQQEAHRAGLAFRSGSPTDLPLAGDACR